MKAIIAPDRGAEQTKGERGGPQLVRLAETGRASLRIFVDDQPVEALEGDTLLTAILTATSLLRQSDFGNGPRAGFCLMGACQDCWVWSETGDRLRACSTAAEAGMRILTTETGGLWPRHA